MSNVLKLVTSFTNPIKNYKEIDTEIKRLEKIKEAYRKEIFDLMDSHEADYFSFDDFKAERKLVVQQRVDSKKLKAIFGDDLSSVQSETSFVKLTVI